MQCHATQFNPDSIFALIPPEVMRELQAWDCFQLAESYVGMTKAPTTCSSGSDKRNVHHHKPVQPGIVLVQLHVALR